MKKLSIFAKKKVTKPNEQVKVNLVTEEGNGFYSWNGTLYKSDVIRSIIRPKVQAVGRMTAKHIRETATELKVNPEPYINFLLSEPNPLMTGQMLQEKLVTQLELNGNAFAVIIDNEYGLPGAIYPITATSVVAEYKDNILYLVFTLKTGNTVTYPYDKIIHLRKDFNENDIFGTNPKDALVGLMEIVTVTDQGIIKAIKNSNIIKWIMKFKQVLNDKDIKSQVKKFANDYLNIESDTGGAMAIDPRYDVEQVKSESYVPNAAQMDKTLQRLYNFFNTNEKIIQSKYGEDDWNAYYESELEPIALQLSNQYSLKLFSRFARSNGNSIIFESSNLSFASMSTKLNLVQMVDRRSLTPNEWRRIMNLSPIEGGDIPIMRLDTATVGGATNEEQE